MNSMSAPRISNLLQAGAICAALLAASIPALSHARTDCRTMLREKCDAQNLTRKECDDYVQSEIFKLRAQMEEGTGIPDCSPDPDPKEASASPAQDKSFTAFLKSFTAESGH